MIFVVDVYVNMQMNLPYQVSNTERYQCYYYLAMLGLKFIHVSKMDPVKCVN